MSRKEVDRAVIVRMALSGKVTNGEGARSLDLSVRQFKRLKARYRAGGGAALMHQLRGRPGNRKLIAGTREQVIALITSTYSGLNDTHLTEKLTEREGLSLSRETVRRIRRSLALPAQRPRRSPQHRSRRLREAREGALVQIDGSPFDWLEGRGPRMCLVGGVDDATGTVLAATFRPNEDLHGYAVVFQQLFTTHGLPLAFYGDGTTILVRSDDHWTLDEQLRGEQDPTHLGRVLHDLGIRYIHAHSPQAKGRIENRWGTFQDRLTSELRLRGVCTLEAANAFLPEFLEDFNRRFARPPRETRSVWRRPPRDLERILACRYRRIVAADNTITLPGHRKSERHAAPCEPVLRPQRPAAPPRTIQIPPGPGRRSYARCRVELRELLDGRLFVVYNGAVIASQPSPSADFALSPRGAVRFGCSSPRAATTQKRLITKRSQSPVRRSTPKSRVQPPSHPWKRGFNRKLQRASTPTGGDISMSQ